MSDFTYYKPDEAFYKIDKLSNGQTIGIFFYRNDYNKRYMYYIYLVIANKKKYIWQSVMGQRDVVSFKETGRCGLEGLLWAKQQIIDFESSDHMHLGDMICVSWLDNRRRNAYIYGLTKIGYKVGHIDNKKCLYKVKANE